MLFQSFPGQGPQNFGLLAKAALPGLLVFESFENLRGDGILLLSGEGFHPTKGFFKQASHIIYDSSVPRSIHWRTASAGT
jgi:hypothetical protein